MRCFGLSLQIQNFSRGGSGDGVNWLMDVVEMLGCLAVVILREEF